MKYVDVNKCIFSGRLCEDPEIKDIGDGKKLARFRLAVECYKKEDKKVNFLKFVTWNCANFAEKNLKRGMKVLVESTCNSGSYLNGSGSKVYTTEFNASLITVLDWRNPSNEQNEATNKANPSNSLPFGNVADIPEEFKRIRIDQIIQALMITILRRIHPLRLMISHHGNVNKSCKKRTRLCGFSFLSKKIFSSNFLSHYN